MAKRVYFAFHYQDVIDFRANVVRKHNFAEGVESAGYYDHSIWETAKSTSPLALKKLINAELQNTSVTVILIGSDTWARPWVRYEIFESIRRGNRVLGIHINSVKGKDGIVVFKFKGSKTREIPWTDVQQIFILYGFFQ